MLQQKYVRGSFLLEENVDDSKVYYEQHKAKVDEVIAWANQLHIRRDGQSNLLGSSR